MRALWKGALSFGLVHIPVSLHNAHSPKEFDFHLLHKKDLSRIRYARICKQEEKEVSWEEIVKGYTTENGKMVVLTDQDFKRANIEKSEIIEILDFTEANEIDPIYYDQPYYLAPEKGAGNAYALLFESLKSSGKVAIGRFVFHNHEHIGVIRPYQNLLILHQLRYHSEMKDTRVFKIAHPKIASTEKALALKLIEELTAPFHPEKYSDRYIDKVKAVIRKKAKGGKQSVSKKPPPTESRRIQNILSLLQASLKKSKKKAA